MKLVTVTRPMLLVVACLLATCVALGQDEESARRRRSARSAAAEAVEITPSAQFPAAPPSARLRPEGWFAARKPKDRPARPQEPAKVFVIPIRTEISNALYETIGRKALQARAEGADLVIFDMDTPGGELWAMEDITALILDGELRNIYTVVYVNRNAFSAGAMISLAASEITMAPSGRIGDAMPIMLGPQGLVEIPAAERVKIESGAKALVRSVAARNDYNLAIGNAMVTISEELWLVRSTLTSELQIIDPNDPAWEGRVLRAPTRKTAAVAEGPAPAGSAEQTARITASPGPWEFLKTIDGPDELATFSADEAVEAGLVDYVLPTLDDLYAHYQVRGKPTYLADTWSERLVMFLTSPPVMALLMFLGIIGAYVEITTPGFGVPGTVAIVCFALVFGSRYLIGLALWWEIVLIVVGLILLALEIFVIPGFGVAGVLGGLCLLVGLVGALIPQAPDKWPVPDTALAWDMFTSGTLALGIGFVAALLAMPILSKFLPRIPVANRLVIAPSQAATDAPVSEASPMKRVRVGDAGVVEGMCRPVGKVRFGDELLDAMTEGDYIEAGARVRVTRREGNRLIVERVPET